MMTPECLWPSESARKRPRRISLLPEQRLASQWFRSQAAALYAGREKVVGVPFGKSCSLTSSWVACSPCGRVRGEYFFARKLSFLCRTMIVFTEMDALAGVSSIVSRQL